MVAVNQLNVMDPNSLSELRRVAREGNSREALKMASQQFEAMFLQMVLKAMRDATPQDGLFDNDQTRMFQEMHDQQLASDLARRGGGTGLADAIFRQLGGDRLDGPQGETGNGHFEVASIPRRPAAFAARQDGAASFADAAEVSGAASARKRVGTPSAAMPASAGERRGAGEATGEASSFSVPERVQSFVDRIWSHARKAGETIGVPPQFIVAQAALETGWGRAELRKSDGSPSYNVFNIKAGANWKGDVVELPVTEYANGRPYTEKARFRAYGSYAEAFQDYANLLRNSSRYAQVLGQREASDFARSLQNAGYATDPAYADKLTRVIGGPTLRAATPG